MGADDNSGMSRDFPFEALTGATRLTDWGVIRAHGEDTRNFLNGQLTQEVLHLGPGQARLAGFCSAKGRLQASFVVWSPQPDEVLLACSADLLPAVLKRLSMFVLRAKCKLTDASAEVALWGVTDPSGAAGADERPWTTVVDQGRTSIRLPAAIVQGRTVARTLVAQGADEPPPAAALADPGLWRWLEVASGAARIVAATADHFVPQMVNLELVGGVNFQKGCYPGQEIVARSQYRGTLKRRAFLLDSDAPLDPAMELFHSSDREQPAGEVVLAASFDGRHAALAELKIAATLEGELRAGAPDGPRLRLGTLPYPIPAEQG